MYVDARVANLAKRTTQKSDRGSKGRSQFWSDRLDSVQ